MTLILQKGVVNINTKDVEELAIDVVKRSIIKSGFLSQHINENDKEQFWDGFVYIYNNKQKRKEDFEGRVPVQVKGTLKSDLSKDEISYSVDMVDLKGYLKDGGIIFFVVYINEEENKEKIYYNALSPVKLIALIEKYKSQGSKSIKFKSFPEESEKKSTVFYQFFNECKKQSSFKSADMLSVEDINEISSITVSVNALGYAEKDIEKAFLESEAYLYGIKPGSSIPIPFKLTPDHLFVVEKQECVISVKGENFYSYFEKVKYADKTKIKIGDSFTIEINGDQTYTWKYKPTNMLTHRIKDMFFIISAIENRGFEINGNFFELIPQGQKLKGYNRKSKKEELDFLIKAKQALDILNVKKDLDISKLEAKDFRELHNLIIALIEKKPVKGLRKDLPPVTKIKIQNITLALTFKQSKDFEDEYVIGDFVNTDLAVYYGGDKGEENHYLTHQISLLKPDDFCEIDNLDYDTIVPAYQKLVSVNPDVVVRANLDMLNILSAYDICKKKELLILAENINNWIRDTALNEQLSSDITLLNSLQIAKRLRPLNDAELQELIELTESTEISEESKIGAYVLLGNTPAAKYHLSKLNAERQEEFKAYPIYNLLED